MTTLFQSSADAPDGPFGPHTEATEAINSEPDMTAQHPDQLDLEGLSVEAYNALLDPFMEIAQAIHDEAYTNGFADAKYDNADVEYDRDALIETLDGECRRDSFYEGLEHDARAKFEDILAAHAERLRALEAEGGSEVYDEGHADGVASAQDVIDSLVERATTAEALATSQAEIIKGLMDELIAGVNLQLEHYGDATKLHMAMIGWAKSARAAIALARTPTGSDEARTDAGAVGGEEQ